MASTYLTYTQQSPSTAEGQKFTLSMWVKKTANTDMGLYGNTYSNTHRGYIYFDGNDRLSYYDSNGVNYTTTRVFRDNNSFYHIVVSVDTTLSTSSDRIKFYVNGLRETVFTNSSAPNQNDTLKLMNTTNTPNMGRMVEAGTSYYFQGVISHAHFTQGYTYDATPFGETDSTTGEWKIKTDVSVTYGNDGYFILKDGNSVTDQSGNGNNFTVGGGTLTKTEDSPSNVFATLNPLSTKAILSHGNTESEHDGSATGYLSSVTTLGMTSGKYYCECKLTVTTGYPGIGIASTDSVVAQNKFSDSYIGESSDSYGYYTPNGYLYNSGNATTGLTTFATNDIIAMALDLDSTQNTLKYYKNGTLVYTVNIPDNSSGWFFASVHTNSQTSARAKFNFGNGYFRSDAVSSAGTNASGNGIFEYDVPTGYTALSTKGLNL